MVLLLPLAFSTIQCKIDAPDAHDGNSVSRNAAGGIVEEKIYSKASQEDDFADDRVVIILNKTATFKFKTYTPEDFPGIDCLLVTDSTEFGMEIVKQQLEAEKTRNWSKLKKRIEMGMLMDVDSFRRIIDLHLAVKSKENVLKAIRLLEKREDILYAGPDYFMELCALPSPMPAYYDSYQRTKFDSVSLPSAWDIVVGDSEEPQWSRLKVGVLDSGIQADHPDLANRIDKTLCRDFTTTTTGVAGGLQDPYGHGTLVAGIIGANGTRLTGVCWGVALVSLRVFDSGMSLKNNSSRVRYAVDFAKKNNIPILNYSGLVLSTDTDFYDLYLSIRQYPGLFVCAAGNYQEDNDKVPLYPSNFTVKSNYGPGLSNLISVGAYTITSTGEERIAENYDSGWIKKEEPGSNYGEKTVDLFAPGTSIFSTDHNNGYAYMSGTSAATPFVTGVAALVKSLHPEMTGAELKIALRKSVVVGLGAPLINKCSTGGKLNAENAVKYIQIVGSIDVNFKGSTTIVNGMPLQTAIGMPVGNILMGKFHLFSNGKWALVEMGKLSNPIYNFHAWDYPQSIEFGSIPQEIKNYMNNAGISTISSGFRIYVPTMGFPSEPYYYWDFDFYFTLYRTGVQVDPWVRFYRHEQLQASDQRKIRVQNFYGSL